MAFVFDNKKQTKIKNTKFLIWRMELGSFHYDVKYRSGRLNQAADVFTRVKEGKVEMLVLWLRPINFTKFTKS